ncbi:MAG TPA: hypothetical protein VGF28_19955 [Thermoanaerobaculia bacterium]
MRQLFAILLLLTAAVHPLAHFGDELVVCPCVHGAVVELAAPAVEREEAAPHTYQAVLPAYVAVAAESELPARAPPVA